MLCFITDGVLESMMDLNTAYLKSHTTADDLGAGAGGSLSPTVHLCTGRGWCRKAPLSWKHSLSGLFYLGSLCRGGPWVQDERDQTLGPG